MNPREQAVALVADWAPTEEAETVEIVAPVAPVEPAAPVDAGCGSDPAACSRLLAGPRPWPVPAAADTDWETRQRSVAAPVHRLPWNSTA